MSGVANAAMAMHRCCRSIAVHPGTPKERLRSVAEQIVGLSWVTAIFTKPATNGHAAAKLLEGVRAGLERARPTDIAPGTVAEGNVDAMSDEDALATIVTLFHIDWCFSFFPDDPNEETEPRER